MLDDDPVTLKTKHGPIVALPYTFEVHDIVMMNLQHLPSEAFHARAIDHFRCLYAELAERAKIMAISCHPYLSGVPHRIAHVERTFADILAHDGVVAGRAASSTGTRADGGQPDRLPFPNFSAEPSRPRCARMRHAREYLRRQCSAFKASLAIC